MPDSDAADILLTMESTCVFCGLLRDDAPAIWVARGPIASALLPRPEGRLAPGHTLVIPNDHAVGVQDVPSDGLAAVTRLVQRVARAMDRALGATGVNVLNASGPNSDQSVPHLHFHVVPRWADDGLDLWPTGRSRQHPRHDWADALRADLAGPA